MILGIAGGTLFVAAYALGVQYLWNWLVPELFHGPPLGIWQTVGLILLVKLLVGFGGGGRWGSGGYKHYMWKQKMKEKFGNMTPEERAAWKSSMKDRWCRPGDGSSAEEVGQN